MAKRKPIFPDELSISLFIDQVSLEITPALENRKDTDGHLYTTKIEVNETLKTKIG